MAGMSDVESSADEPESTADRAGRGCLFGFIGLVAVVVLAIVVPLALAMAGVWDDDDWEPTPDQAIRMCEESLSEKLKAPSTAEFSGQSATSTGSDAWAVSGEVDAQNGFGAMVRSSWACDMRWDSADEIWRGSATLIE